MLVIVAVLFVEGSSWSLLWGWQILLLWWLVSCNKSEQLSLMKLVHFKQLGFLEMVYSDLHYKPGACCGGGKYCCCGGW